MNDEEILDKISELTKFGKIFWEPGSSDQPGGRVWKAEVATRAQKTFKLTIEEFQPRCLCISIDGNMLLHRSAAINPVVKELVDYVCSGQQRFKKAKLNDLGRHLNNL